MVNVHGHAVMQWLVEAPHPLSLAEIENRVAAAFGPAVRFHTCDTGGHTLSELLALLEARGKVWPVGACYASERRRLCADSA